jgi:hypothetical protein
MAAFHNNLDTRDSAVEIENIVDVKTDGSHKPPPDGEILFFAKILCMSPFLRQRSSSTSKQGVVVHTYVRVG